MTIQEVNATAKDLMTKTIEHFKGQLSKVRTGRASANMIDGVYVDYYGSSTPVNQIANVSTPDARTIVVQPFDKSTLKEIEKAIGSADLGFNPQNDGQIIRIPVPPLTEERRKEFVKLCKKYCEDTKVAVRNVRRDLIDELKKAEKSKIITEDDRKRGEEEVQKVTDDFVKQADSVLEKKEKELMQD